MSTTLQTDPNDPDILIAPLTDGSGTYQIELGEDGDAWCLACEALDADKTWRFTPEQAARLRWLICGDCTDLIHMVLDPVFTDEEDPDPMVMSLPSAD